MVNCLYLDQLALLLVLACQVVICFEILLLVYYGLQLVLASETTCFAPLETDHGTDRLSSDRQVVDADGPGTRQQVPLRRRVRAVREAVARSRSGKQH